MKDVTKGIDKEYEERERGQASTSKYIQEQTPPLTGDTFVSNTISGTPDDKLISPNLKTITGETISLKQQTQAGVPVPLPLKKTKNKIEFKEPKPTGHLAQYGKINVHDNSGFVEIQDCTPKNRRKVSIHPSGSYSQTIDNGDVLEKSVHDKISITINDWNISVGNDEITVIVGNQKLQIKKDRQTNIDGDDNTFISGNSNTIINKDRGVQIEGSNLQTINKDNIVDVTGNSTENIKKDFHHTVNGSETNMVLKDKTDIIMGTLILTTSDHIIIHAGNDSNVSVTGKLHINSTGETTIEAPTINLNGYIKTTSHVEVGSGVSGTFSNVIVQNGIVVAGN